MIESRSKRFVLSSQVSVSFDGGKIVVQGASGTSLVFSDPMALLILTRFQSPRSISECEAAEPYAAEVLNDLVSIGALVPQTPSCHDCQETEASSKSTHAQITSGLVTLANTVYDIAGDVAAFGPNCEKLVRDHTGIGVARRVQALVDGASDLRYRLLERHNEFVLSQLEEVDISETPLKIHIGSGVSKIDGWLNIDVFPAQVSMNIRWGLPFTDSSVQYVFLSHVLEHLFYPGEALDLAKEMNRVLVNTGVMRVIVPDIEQCLRAYVSGDDEFFSCRKDTWTWWRPSRTRLEDFLAYAGAGPYPGCFLDGHKFGYDFETLAMLLERAGFRRIRRSSYQASDDQVLRVDHCSLVAGAKHGDQYYSLFVDAMK